MNIKTHINIKPHFNSREIISNMAVIPLVLGIWPIIFNHWSFSIMWPGAGNLIGWCQDQGWFVCIAWKWVSIISGRVRLILVQPILIPIYSPSQYFCWYQYICTIILAGNTDINIFNFGQYLTDNGYFARYMTIFCHIFMYFCWFFAETNTNNIQCSQNKYQYQYGRYR